MVAVQLAQPKGLAGAKLNTGVRGGAQRAARRFVTLVKAQKVRVRLDPSVARWVACDSGPIGFDAFNNGINVCSKSMRTGDLPSHWGGARRLSTPSTGRRLSDWISLVSALPRMRVKLLFIFKIDPNLRLSSAVTRLSHHNSESDCLFLPNLVPLPMFPRNSPAMYFHLDHRIPVD